MTTTASTLPDLPVYHRQPTEAEWQAARTLWDYQNLAKDQEGELAASDLILALGSNELRVADRAAELWQAGSAPRIIVSGGNSFKKGDRPTEAERFRDRLIELGVPAEVILLENRATKTPDNIQYSRELLGTDDRAPERIILVGAPQHTRRIALTALKQWPEPTFVTAAPRETFEEFFATTPYYQIGKIRSLAGQTLRNLVYAEKGDIAYDTIPADVTEATNFLLEAGYEPLGAEGLAKDIQEHGLPPELARSLRELQERYPHVFVPKKEGGDPNEGGRQRLS